MNTSTANPTVTLPEAAQIRQCLTEIQAKRDWFSELAQAESAFNQEYYADLLKAYYAIPGAKHRKNPLKARIEAFNAMAKVPALKAVEEDWKTKANAIVKEKDAYIEQREKRIAELATIARLADERTETVWNVFRWYYGGTYSSQGYGAEKYLMASIEKDKDLIREHVADEDMKVENSPGGKTLYVRYTDVGVAIIKNLPTPDLRTIIKNMLKRGVNPRVYYPFLPHGYEQKVGLDYAE